MPGPRSEWGHRDDENYGETVTSMYPFVILHRPAPPSNACAELPKSVFWGATF
jgi:hypothetical protein